MWPWIVSCFLVTGLIAALRPMKVRRKPGLERDFDKPAAIAYNGMGNCFIFGVERRVFLRKLNSCLPHGIVVDVGCGPGYLLRDINRRYPELGLVGLDNNSDFLAMARQNLEGIRISLINARAEEMPLTDDSYDLIVSTGSLHHWADASLALGEIHRVLKPGGQFLIMDLRRDCPRLFYILIQLTQRLMPYPIQCHNGPLGSFWASYTVPETRHLIEEVPLKDRSVEKGFGWFVAWGRK